MRATDLLGAVVYDSEGVPVGAVRDLRLTAGGGRAVRVVRAVRATRSAQPSM